MRLVNLMGCPKACSHFFFFYKASDSLQQVWSLPLQCFSHNIGREDNAAVSPAAACTGSENSGGFEAVSPQTGDQAGPGHTESLLCP